MRGDGKVASAPATVTVTVGPAQPLAVVVDRAEPLSGTVTLSLNQAVTGTVTWFVDLAQVGTGATLPWNTKGVGNGSHLVVARVQPAKLVRGLAEAVERRGVRIAEQTEVLAIEPARVRTARGTVRAPIVLRCTEGFSATLPGARREWLPLNSAQVITEPLPESAWREIGWDGHEILGDFANAYCYCQRTREGRIAVGGRGTPYRFGSAIDSRGAPDPATVEGLVAILHRHFPAARGARIAHAWCGVLGVPRDWCATVGLDAGTGIGWAGGYVGVGVSTSNLAGRTLADLALGRTTELTQLPWVNRRVRRWEPEPLRWLGVHGMYALLRAGDRREQTGGAPSRLAVLGNWLTGR